MASEAPFFSILIPSYNRPEYVGSCIDSILANDFDDYEILVSDDCSPKGDAVKSVLEPYVSQGKISFFSQPTNLREPENKNFLVRQAKGKFNIILGDDDRFYPYTLKELKKFIDQHPSYGLYAFGYTVIDEKDSFYYARQAPTALEISLASEWIAKLFFMSDIFPFWLYHPATFCCRNDLEKDIAYRADAGIGEDVLFLFDLINRGEKMRVIPESLFLWRKNQQNVHQGQMNQSLGDFSNVEARAKILTHLEHRQDLHPKVAEWIRRPEFRKFFLYRPILVDKSCSRERIERLGLSQIHLDEYNDFAQRSNWADRRIKPYLDRSLVFIRLFGFWGFINILQVGIQRACYRLRKRIVRTV